MKHKDQLLLEEAYKNITQTTKPNTLEEFVKNRRSGALKIATAAENKGSYATLTAYHFKAKDNPYSDALDQNEDKAKHLHKKASEALKKLQKWDSLSQKEFQELTGIFEVYGEVYIQSITNKKYISKK